MQRRTVTLSVVMIAVALSGCQREKKYEYEVWGVIRDFSTGKPLDRVVVDLVEHESDRLPTTTNANGRFWGRYEILDSEFGDHPPNMLPERKLKLSKEGYQDEYVDVSPMLEPTSEKRPIRVEVVAYMRAEE